MRRRPSRENSRRGACRAWEARRVWGEEEAARSKEAEGWRVVRWAATRHQEEAWLEGLVVRWVEGTVFHLRSTMRR